MTAIWLLALAAMGLLTSIRWPGWSAAAARRLWTLCVPVIALAGASILGVAIEPYAHEWARQWAIENLLPLLVPIGTWFIGPTLPRDLLAAVPLLAVLLLDAAWPGSLTLGTLRATATWLAMRGAQAVGALAAILPLLWGWADVVASTAGRPGRQWYAAAGAAGVPLPGPLLLEPDHRLPAFAWWLVACILAVRAARRPRTPAARLWLGVPLAGGILAYVARPAALTLAVPIYLGVSVGIAAVAASRTPGRRWQRALPTLAGAALFGIIALALSLRWVSLVATAGDPLSSDANGYYEVAREFHRRVALVDTNPIALAYLNLHPAGREPLFPMLARLVFDAIGESALHLRYVSLLGALGAVIVTYLFGRAVLGVAAGLGAALLLALEPWHISGSHQGLREEVGMFFVYALATLVVVRARGGIGAALAGGLLAAAAVLTRLDSAAVVAFLLVAWGIGLGSAWRRSLVAWGVLGTLVIPMLIGYHLRFGQALAPVGATMGGDIRELVGPLLRLEYPLYDIVHYLAVGTVRIFSETVFNGSIGYLTPFFGDFAALVILGCFMLGILSLLVRGPRLPAALSLLGLYLPPFAFIAGIIPEGGPYSNRYTYLVLPAAYVVLVWTVTRPLTWLARGLHPGGTPASERRPRPGAR